MSWTYTKDRFKNTTFDTGHSSAMEIQLPIATSANANLMEWASQSENVNAAITTENVWGNLFEKSYVSTKVKIIHMFLYNTLFF